MHNQNNNASIWDLETLKREIKEYNLEFFSKYLKKYSVLNNDIEFIKDELAFVQKEIDESFNDGLNKQYFQHIKSVILKYCKINDIAIAPNTVLLGLGFIKALQFFKSIDTKKMLMTILITLSVSWCLAAAVRFSNYYEFVWTHATQDPAVKKLCDDKQATIQNLIKTPSLAWALQPKKFPGLNAVDFDLAAHVAGYLPAYCNLIR